MENHPDDLLQDCLDSYNNSEFKDKMTFGEYSIFYVKYQMYWDSYHILELLREKFE